jgi:hypothetical protein
VPEPGGLWDERYVWTGVVGTGTKAQAVLGVFILNAIDPTVRALDVVAACPCAVGQLTITAATSDWVSFTGPTGLSGSFDLGRRTWKLDDSPRPTR